MGLVFNVFNVTLIILSKTCFVAFLFFLSRITVIENFKAIVYEFMTILCKPHSLGCIALTVQSSAIVVFCKL